MYSAGTVKKHVVYSIHAASSFVDKCPSQKNSTWALMNRKIFEKNVYRCCPCKHGVGVVVDVVVMTS